MARYEVGIQTVGTVSGDPIWELFASATDRLILKELWLSWNDVTKSVAFRLHRTTTPGATPTTPVLGQAQDSSGPAATGQVAVAWGTLPVMVANTYLWRGIMSGAAIFHGARIGMRFRGSGIVIPASGSVGITTGAAPPLVEVTAVWTE